MITKKVLKIWIIINKKHFVIFLEQLHTQEYKATKKHTVRHQLNEKKSKEIETRLMSWCWKRKPSWRKDLLTYNSYPWIIYFFLIDWLSFGDRGRNSFELGRPRTRTWKNFGGRWTRSSGVLKIGQFLWTSYVYYP